QHDVFNLLGHMEGVRDSGPHPLDASVQDKLIMRLTRGKQVLVLNWQCSWASTLLQDDIHHLTGTVPLYAVLSHTVRVHVRTDAVTIHEGIPCDDEQLNSMH